MMRSDDQSRHDVKSVSLLQLVEAAGVKLIRDGDNWKGPCPFHSDSSQSLVVNPDQNHWQCLGECQAGGSVVEWIMKVKGVSKSHAVELLRNNAAVTNVNSDPLVTHSSVRRIETPFAQAHSDQEVLQHVVDYYHEALKQSPKAMAYLKKRGLIHGDVIEHFKLGFSDRTLGYRLPEKNRKEGAALRGRLQRLGILKPSGHERFHGSLVVPIIENGLVKQFYGRKITSKLRSGTPLHTFLPGPKQGFFNRKAIDACKELILCPSIIDALTFWCAGHQNVTCSYGVGQIIDNDLETLHASPVRRVLIAYAGTKEGDTSASQLAEQLMGLDMDCYRIEFSKGMDANDHALAHQPANKSLGEVIRKAAWLGKGQASAPVSPVAELPDLQPEETSDVSPTTDAEPTPSTTPKRTTASEDQAPEVVLSENESNTDQITEIIPATVLPSPSSDSQAEVKDNEVVMCFEDRRYRVRGLNKNLSVDQLKVNLLVNREAALHVDTFDLYAARPRLNFIKQAALELGIDEAVIKKDLSLVLLKLEELQDKNIKQAITPSVTRDPMTKQERREALSLLQSPHLLDRILEDYGHCGVVGEKTNLLVGYLATMSRKLDKPLAVIIQSTSAAGKSALMEAILSFVPAEERMQYSAMTGQSLFYMGDIDLKHKILAISEEEGASHATYALKILQSEGQLTIASTCKDPDSGRHMTREYRVEGPVMIFSTTTAIDIDEELLNRCLILTVDEGRTQTRAIHDYQRFEETLEGLQASQVRDDMLRVHRNAQRLIKPLKVVNPYAKYLTFLDDKTRTRRDHKKYLTLIRSIALLHQYQREVKQTYSRGKSLSYVEVTLDDIAMANQLAHEVLGRSLDELPPQTRNLLHLLDTMVTECCEVMHITRGEVRFSRRDVRAYTGWGDTQLKVHLQRLEAMEYLHIHRGGRGKRIIYELLYNCEGQDGSPFLMGLMDSETLKKRAETANRPAVRDNLSGSTRAQVGRKSATGRNPRKRNYLNKNKYMDANRDVQHPKTDIRGNPPPASYRSRTSYTPEGGATP